MAFLPLSRWHLSVAILAALAAATFCHPACAAPRDYPFTRSPLEILDALPSLKLDTPPMLPAAEREFLTNVWQWRSVEASGEQPHSSLVLDAMLFASGVEDDAARAKYREEFDQVIAAAREAVKDAQDDCQRGEKLLAHLHASLLSKGYDDEQSSLAAIFDSRQYNCVSASALYYLAGTQLGLALRPISIPGSAFASGHASLDLIDVGMRIQIEPTNPDGFDWAAKVKRPGVRVLGFIPDRRNGHEVDALGLAALIYANRGVALQKAKPPQRLAAARCYLAALALDPANDTAANNVRSIFVNWGPELAAAGKHDEAIRVLGFGRSFAPQSDELRRNLVHVYDQYIDAVLAAGKDEQALALIRRAADDLPAEREFAGPAASFIRRGQRALKEAGYEAALAVVERGLPLVSAAEGHKLRQWRSSLFRRWSQEYLDKGDFDGSVQVLARAHSLDPGDREIGHGLAYHAQKALAALDAAGAAAMASHFQSLRSRFPDVKAIDEAGWSHAARAVHKLAESGQFEDALKAVGRYQPLLAGAEQTSELAAIVYGLWGSKLAATGRWQAALDKLAEGRKEYPHQRRLEEHLAATIDAWAKPAIAAKNWDEALRIYDLGLASYLPGNPHLANNRAYCQAMKQREGR